MHTGIARTPFIKFTSGCVNTSSLQCDFTRLNVSIIEYGKYTGRVRAQRGAQSSASVESNQISLDQDTLIGAPNVSLLSNGATIDVSIKDPVFVVSSLRRVYILATYNITYWKDGQKETAKSIANLQQNRVVLDDLDVRTKYCVQVQINTERNSRPSELSKPVCERTADKEEAPWVAAVVTFVVMAAAVALVVVAVVNRRSISHFLCPKDALPQHFKDYPPSNSKVYVAMQNSHPPTEVYHPVSIIADGRTVE
ncbi:interleukin-10 receptor subunit beta-like isoform 2-T2 [Symphorus nematophorus]